MAWETRNGRGRYFAMSGSVNGRTTRIYYGVGALGETAAAVYAARRRAREMRVATRTADEAHWNASVELADSAFTPIHQLTELTLLGAGYYYHDGCEWRPQPQRRFACPHPPTP